MVGVADRVLTQHPRGFPRRHFVTVLRARW
jgi:hypothetical protein